jgi:EAL domain-containing protein (putative c-di-GMP-specific phosphodiesterase class I)
VQSLDPGDGGLGVAVNVSARQFEDEEFPSVVQDALANSGLAHQRLTLELTESILMVDAEKTEQVLRSLKDLGVRLALDDFGTGYSSLAYLKRFPLDELKIDRSFIQDIPDDAQDAAIVEAVLAIARSLNLSVTAEGIETVQQRSFLSERRCQDYQGYLFSRPVPLEAFTKLL